MKGLSEKEIERKKDELYFKYYGNEVRTPNNLKQEWTKEEKQEMKELSFRSWCNSCLIYGTTWNFKPEELSKYDSCIMSSTLELYEVSLERALEIVEEQEERFKTARITYNVYTDSEGCTYNSCNWGD